MLDFLNLNINPKINVSVHKNAFVDIVRSLPQHISDIHIENEKTNIEFVQNNKNIVFFLNVKIKRGVSIGQKLEEIKTKIETHSKMLINKKPYNIIINFVGEF